MSEKPVAIILGGIFPHSELIRKLKKRGYYTLLIDYFKNPPAAQYADEHSTASAMDYRAVLDIARERDAKLVIASCLDQQIVIAMQVSEALGLPHPFSSETALNVTNKKYMKKVMMANHIPTARYYQVDSSTDLGSIDLDYPVIVKPTDSCGSAGVAKVTEEAALEAAVRTAVEFSRSSEVIVEEFKEGMEVSAYTYIADGKAHLVTTSERICDLTGSIVKCYSALSPARISGAIRQKMEDIATQIAQAFHLNNTPLFFQSIVSGEDVFIIEFSPRLGGGLCYRTMQLNAKFEMLDASIDSYFGKQPVMNNQPEETYYLIHQVHGVDGVFGCLEGKEQVIEAGYVNEIFEMKTNGMEISTHKSSGARVAMLLIEGKEESILLDKLHKAMKLLAVRDINGVDITDRSLILTQKVLEDRLNATSPV